MSVSQLKATLPGQNSGPMRLLNARNSFDFINPVSALIAGLLSTLPASDTREIHNILQILTHLL